MLQVPLIWNLIQPERELKTSVGNISRRGYNPDTFLTWELSKAIERREIKSLSVSNIADRLCPTRRDLFFSKKTGLAVPSRKTWGRSAGLLVESHLLELLNQKTKKIKGTAKSIATETQTISNKFSSRDRTKSFLKDLDSSSSRPEENSEWLLKLLKFNAKFAIASHLLNNSLFGTSKLMSKDIKTGQELHPKAKEIGISSGVKPDFLIEKFNAVGDIKSGMPKFEDRYLLTCIGYALAYENANGPGHDINFGIIYFFPTRYSKYAKPIGLPQVYIFLIDDNTREWFLNVRTDAYNTIKSANPPPFPDKNNIENCKSFCKFYNHCKMKGLETWGVIRWLKSYGLR